MKLKVKPLEWYMEDKDAEDFAEEGYRSVADDFELVGRDGYYCRGNSVWFEVAGRGYIAYRNNHKAREYFCYTFAVNDEAILPVREVEAMEQVLKTSRDSAVRKAISKRLNLHNASKERNNSIRRATMLRIKIIGR